MIKTSFKPHLLLCLLILSACAGKTDTRPSIIVNAENYTNDGVQAYADADWQRAQVLFTQALTFYQGIDNQQGILLSHINLAEVALMMHDYPAAEKHLSAASIIADKSQQIDIQSRISLLYAQNALKQNQLALAKTHLQALLPEFNDQTPVGTASHLQLAACADRTQIAFAENSDASLWTQRYANALMLSGINDSDLEPRLLRFQAELLQQQGGYDAAESKLQQALIEYKKTLSRPGIAITLSELGQLSMAQEQWQNAKEYIERAIAVFQYLKNVRQISQLQNNLADIDAILLSKCKSHKK